MGGHAVLSDGTGVFVPLGDAIDVGRECDRLGAEVERLARAHRRAGEEARQRAVHRRAPAAVVEREREKLASWREQHEVLARKRALLGCV